MKLVRVYLLFTLACSQCVNAERLDEQRLNQFVKAQISLKSGIDDYCHSVDKSLPMAQWVSAASAWYQVQGLQLAATQFMQVDHTFVFWPDSKDRLRKQVNTAIKQSPAETVWKDLPSATKGLSAIEYIFTQTDAKQHCLWLKEISTNQIEQATKLQALQALYEYGLFEQVNALHGTVSVAHSQLKEVLAQPDKTVWQLAPAWRSNNGWHIQVKLSEQIGYLLNALLEEDVSILPWQTKLLEFHVTEELPNRKGLIAYNQFLTEVATYVEATLAPNLDIYLGFNNFDGD